MEGDTCLPGAHVNLIQIKFVKILPVIAKTYNYSCCHQAWHNPLFVVWNIYYLQRARQVCFSHHLVNLDFVFTLVYLCNITISFKDLNNFAATKKAQKEKKSGSK